MRLDIMIKKEYEILAVIIKEPWKEFTFKDIKKLSGKKSESYVYNSLKKLVKTKILIEKRVGKTVVYSFNYFSLKAQSYAGFTSEYITWHRKNIPYTEIEKIASKIPTSFYLLLITGSYAEGTERKNSDIDLIIIVDDSLETKKVYSELAHECEMSIPKIHLYVFKKSEFISMLLDEKANYGKEAVKKNIILYGGQEYYNIIAGAIKHGFHG